MSILESSFRKYAGQTYKKLYNATHNNAEYDQFLDHQNDMFDQLSASSLEAWSHIVAPSELYAGPQILYQYI